MTATSSKTPLHYQWYRCDKNGYNSVTYTVEAKGGKAQFKVE